MPISFTTLAGLKSCAKKAQRERNIPLNQALDWVARQGGFECYVHALRHLPDRTPYAHSVTVIQHWWGYQSREGGDAEISVSLRHSLEDLVRPHHLTGYLGGSTIRGDAIVEREGQQRHEDETRWYIARIARTLQFMDATGLKPSSARKCYPNGEWDNRPPIADHDHCWFDPVEGVHVLTTEPYPSRSEYRSAEQGDWETKHGWRTLHSAWEGIYAFDTEFYLCCPQTYAATLRQRIKRLEAGPAAVSEAAVAIRPWKPRPTLVV